jgi:hypothetical protein
MSDQFTRVEPAIPDRTTTGSTSVSPPIVAPTASAGATSTGDHRGPLDDIEVERPRTHPLTYLALALGTLALLLSLAALARHDGHGYRQVKIGANDCVIGRQAGADVLYCRAANVP